MKSGLNKISGEYLAQSLNRIISKRKIEIIREVALDFWNDTMGVDIPDFQKPVEKTFEYHFYKYLDRVEKSGRFHDIFNKCHQLVIDKRIWNLRQDLNG